MRIIKQLQKIAILLCSAAAIFLSGCSGTSMKGAILITEIPQELELDYSPWHVPQLEGARIVAVQPGGKTKILSVDFYAAITPTVSHDGKNMLFAAKEQAGDNWQIWEMKLSSGKTRQLTLGETDCTNPTYLPINRFAFTKQLSSAKIKDCNQVFTANLDGSNLQQITFSPQTFAALTVLKDGRFLAMEKQIYPKEGEQNLMVMRPDGTKLELFYKSENGKYVQSKVIENSNDKMLFVERSGSKSNIISLSYGMPLHSHKILSEGIEGEFLSVSNGEEENALVVYRKSEDENFGLFTFDTAKSLVEEIYQSKGYNVIEATKVKVMQRPRNLPSAVKLEEPSGLLLCQDVNFSGHVETNNDRAQKIEFLGVDTSLGVISVEEDGSFYVKIEADLPFRIQTLSADNEVINGPGSWYYIRPNERRACVGCHTGPAISPFNRQPLSVRKDPRIIKQNSDLSLKNANAKDYEHE
ncbi:HzsA-related protein [Draconibacterium halophilum]|uniref:Hydrazine synthase alpha subunit middle domain-containing protein n=1 Tax=Draconibacterium halophilum TaxID=2706887 RepID=A0A6C0RBJ8_9BACT|nr:hypothetical protein [Draconibacterium halophilum]QIA07700.1 hypothetical protein G0Q07_08155 [Draconibacterium halophilum]